MYVISRDSTDKTRSLYCNSTAEKKKSETQIPCNEVHFQN